MLASCSEYTVFVQHISVDLQLPAALVAPAKHNDQPCKQMWTILYSMVASYRSTVY